MSSLPPPGQIPSPGWSPTPGPRFRPYRPPSLRQPTAGLTGTHPYPRVWRPSAGVNVAGAFVGPIVALLGLFLLSDSIHHLQTAQSRLRDAPIERLLELLLGAVILGAIVLAGRWVPTAPLVAGALFAVVGVLAQVSTDVFRRLWDWWPTDRGRFGWGNLLGNGTLIVVGIVLIAGGVSHLLAKR